MFCRAICRSHVSWFQGDLLGGVVQQDPSGASNTRSTLWNNHTVKFGWYVQGIYPPMTDGSHINIVEQSKQKNIIATGDDYGLVNTYRSPCLEDHHARSYRGHSEHVTNVKIHGPEMQTMCSLGGQDQTLIQWRKLDPSEHQQWWTKQVEKENTFNVDAEKGEHT